MSEPLLHQVATGRASAMKACIDQYGHLVWTLARRMTDTHEEAERAAQSAFAELWKNAARYDMRLASETAFIATFARRHFVDLRRSANEALVWGQLDGSAEDAFEESPHSAEMSDEAERAIAAMRQLRPEQQEVLKLAIFDGLSHDAIAEKTGMSTSMVKTHVRRGLIRLRHLLGTKAVELVPETVS